ncbi:unnamed protein product [Acidithrix sp. C25]|nr:unnamed protein product [Acidithrix sp. C25]
MLPSSPRSKIKARNLAWATEIKDTVRTHGNSTKPWYRIHPYQEIQLETPSDYLKIS